MPEHKEQWEENIEDWEEHRYGGKISLKSIVYCLTRHSSQALHYRKQVPLKHLAPHISGKHIVEIGCGTAPLSQDLIKLGAQTYHGYDISEQAIKIAEERTKANDKISFSCLDILDIPPLEIDFVISIGVTHWVTTDRVDHIFKISQGANFLHHFSEKKLNLKQILRYLHLRYTGVPKYKLWYHNLDEVAEIIKKNGYEKAYKFSDSRLEAITFYSSLPFQPDLI